MFDNKGVSEIKRVVFSSSSCPDPHKNLLYDWILTGFLEFFQGKTFFNKENLPIKPNRQAPVCVW